MNTGEVAERIKLLYHKLKAKKKSFMTWDGSNFDSHQHISLLRAVDH
jgi:hypothetical protein